MGRHKDQLRNLSIGKMEQPKVALTSNIPTGGTDGDIRVQASNSGPALFAKYNGEWYTTPLVKTTGGGGTTQVKTHLMTGTKSSVSSGGTSYIVIDASIVPRGSVVGIILFMNHSGDYWHIYNWKAEDNKVYTEHDVLYRWNTHRVEIRYQGTQINAAKHFKLLIFYT